MLRARGAVYVFTGPVFEPGAQRTSTGGVAVPSHLFKLVYDAETEHSWTHWHQNSAAAKMGRPISYQELIQRTGLKWLSAN